MKFCLSLEQIIKKVATAQSGGTLATMLPKIANMTINKLDNYEIENIEDCIPEIEKMYHFKFDEGETEHIKHFDEFCDLIISKIKLEDVASCSTQQAFYKLRDAIVHSKIANKENIYPETEIRDLFPRKNRIRQIKLVENYLGFTMNILQPPKIVTYSLMAIFGISLILLFISFKYGFFGMVFIIIGFYLCKLWGKEIELKTVKNLVEDIVQNHYLKIRSKTNTVNKSELKSLLYNWISENTGIERERLKSATFE